MAVSIGSGFALHKKAVIDDRTLFETVADMVATPDNWMADMGYAFVKETNALYMFNRNNEVLNDIGKWRLIDGDGAKLKNELVSSTDIGMIKEGTTYNIGTSLETILKDILVGKQLDEDDFYFGTSDTRNIVSLYQFSGSTSSACKIVANNEYIIFAAKEKLGDFTIRDNNGFPYNSDFEKIQITHNGELYNVLIGKYKITSTTGFDYRLSFN